MHWGASIMYMYKLLHNSGMVILHHNNRPLLTTATTTNSVCAKYGHLVDCIYSNIRFSRHIARRPGKNIFAPTSVKISLWVI